MRAQFVNENLNEFNFRKNPKVNANPIKKNVYHTNWAHTFKNENVIDVIRYKNVPIKLIKTGGTPEKYYAILPMKYYTAHKLIPYYSLKSAINSTKNYIDMYYYES